MKPLRALAAGLLTLAASAASAASAQEAAGFRFDYTADAFANLSGGFRDDATIAHQAVLSYAGLLSERWSVRAAAAATFGDSLSERAIGDVQGVQGAYAGGDALWLYEASLTREFARGIVTFGRLSSGDAFGTVGTMGEEFVNSAFSSNGGAVSINDPGRLPSPASSWGATLAWRWSDRLETRGGLFLSDPERATADRPADRSFRPADGVLGFAEVVARPSEAWELGAGAYADSARFDTFDGGSERGNGGLYGWVAGRLAGPDEGRRLDGFLMLQAAPRDDRSLQPFAAFAGLTLAAPFASRPDDALNLAVAAGRFSDDSGLDGAETVLELNYRYAVSDQLSLRPDLQYVINPGGLHDDALVAGVQLLVGL